jgi:serine/threonine-protein kinase
MPASINIDRSLLFVVIALQDDLIDRDQFADVCTGWAVQLERPIAELLIERHWITERDRSDVERKLERKLKKHGGDEGAALGAVAEIRERDVLGSIGSPEIRKSINALAPAKGHVLVETLVRPPSERDTLRYTLTRVLGEGAFGTVWIAHDTDLNRDVALKEIKSTATLSPESLHHFLKEAQITGQLEHPNIVPVYELARRKEDDQPFYTMRFLTGQRLRDAITEFHRRRADKPADRLELLRQLLEPFVKVCEAVGYAHARGVIHRDLKPEHVVLGKHGVVGLLDWGLAKIVGQADDTITARQEPGVVVSPGAETQPTQGQAGTPAYMAPEQAIPRNDLIGTRTDVYGLGAILFEILTGQPPVFGATVDAILHKIKAGNLSKARAIEPTVAPALEAVCAKALAYDRRDRYRSPEDLAEDVRRWLLDEPVSVYRDALPVRLMRWGRHHRTLATTMAALLITAVIGLSIGVVLINQERGRTEAQSRRALHNLRLAQDAADRLLGEVADVDLADIPQMERVRQSLLEKAREGYQQFLVQKGDDPLIRWGAGRSLVRLGDIQSLMGDSAKAEGSYRLAVEQLERLRKQDPANADFRRDLARGLHGEGVLFKDGDRLQQAEGLIRKAIRLREEIARDTDQNPEDIQALNDGRYQLGAVLARAARVGDRVEDRTALEAAIAVQKELVEKIGGQPELRTRLARYRNNLGILQSASADPSDAEKTFRGTLDLLAPSLKDREALPAVRWQLARVSNNLGILLRKERPDDAGSHLRQAEALLQKLVNEFPRVAQYTLELASVESNLGRLAQERQPEKALECYREAARLFGSLKERFPGAPIYRMKLAVGELAIAEVLATTAEEVAETAALKALEELSALQSEYSGVLQYERILGRSHYQVGRVLLVKGKPADAVRHLEQAMALAKQVLQARPDSASDKLYLAEDQILLTEALIKTGRLAEAQTSAEQIPAITPTDPKAYLHAAAFLIRCANAAANTPEGKQLAEDNLARAVKVLGDAVRDRVIQSRKILDIKDLAPLGDRDDFQKLRNSLNESTRPG